MNQIHTRGAFTAVGDGAIKECMTYDGADDVR